MTRIVKLLSLFVVLSFVSGAALAQEALPTDEQPAATATEQATPAAPAKAHKAKAHKVKAHKKAHKSHKKAKAGMEAAPEAAQ